MANRKVGAVAVVDAAGPVGIVNERIFVLRAVARELSSEPSTAKEGMTPNLVSVDIDDAISDALAG